MSSHRDVGGQKMVLVSVPVWEQLKQLQNLEQKRDTMEMIKRPEDAIVYKSFNNMQDTLHANEKDEIKADKHVEALNDFTLLRNKVNNTSSILPTSSTMQPTISVGSTIENDVIQSMPKTLQTQAKLLMSRLKQHPNTISWSPNGEVIIQGTRKSGTNIIDLVGGLLRTRKNVHPQNEHSFLKTLASINLPEEFIRNKSQLPRYREYKRKLLQESNNDTVGDGEYSSAEDNIANVNRLEDVLDSPQQKSLFGKRKHQNIFKPKRIGGKKRITVKWSSV